MVEATSSGSTNGNILIFCPSNARQPTGVGRFSYIDKSPLGLQVQHMSKSTPKKASPADRFSAGERWSRCGKPNAVGRRMETWMKTSWRKTWWLPPIDYLIDVLNHDYCELKIKEKSKFQRDMWLLKSYRFELTDFHHQDLGIAYGIKAGVGMSWPWQLVSCLRPFYYNKYYKTTFNVKHWCGDEPSTVVLHQGRELWTSAWCCCFLGWMLRQKKNQVHQEAREVEK